MAESKALEQRFTKLEASLDKAEAMMGRLEARIMSRFPGSVPLPAELKPHPPLISGGQPGDHRRNFLGERSAQLNAELAAKPPAPTR